MITAAHFHLALVAASISHVVTAAAKWLMFMFLPRKKCLLCFFFLSLAVDLCRPFSRWASLACRLLSLFLCLSLALYSKFVGMTINLSLRRNENWWSVTTVTRYDVVSSRWFWVKIHVFLKFLSTIELNLVDKMKRSTYLCVILHVKHKKITNSLCFYLISNSWWNPRWRPC